MYTAQGEYTCTKKLNIEKFTEEPLPKGSYIDSCKDCVQDKGRHGHMLHSVVDLII